MYKLPMKKVKSLLINVSREGESIERTIQRAMMNKQPLEGQTPLMYTERKQGVLPSTNVRTDRFEVAIEATEKIARSYKARREDKPPVKRDEATKSDGEPESIQGKPETGTENTK